MIYEETKGEAIISTGVGQHQMWAAQWYNYDAPRRWVSSGGLGSMGFGLPSAIGAAVAHDGTDGRPKRVRPVLLKLELPKLIVPDGCATAVGVCGGLGVHGLLACPLLLELLLRTTALMADPRGQASVCPASRS